MTPDLLTLFGQFGPLGLMVWYLVWREKNVAKEMAERDRARAEADKARAEADMALAGSLSALTVTIHSLGPRSA